MFSLQLFFCSYDTPPLYDITLEEFETCALDRLRILAEIESSLGRNRSWDELKSVTTIQCEKYLPLHTSTASTVDRESERRKDHLGHYVLRLAFCRSYVYFQRDAQTCPMTLMVARICVAVSSRRKRRCLRFDMKLTTTRNDNNF